MLFVEAVHAASAADASLLVAAGLAAPPADGSMAAPAEALTAEESAALRACIEAGVQRKAQKAQEELTKAAQGS